MPYPLPPFLAVPVALVAMLYLLFLTTLPFLVPYCVWRVLRDIRTIANCLDVLATEASYNGPMRAFRRADSPPGDGPGITTSALGR